MFFSAEITLATGLTRTWLDLGIQLSRRKSIRFQVKATNDVYIVLSSGNNTDSPGYGVLLGWEGKKSCLREVHISQCYSTYSGPVLSGEQYRSFWLTWNEGHVRVGTGETPDNGTIMDHVFTNVYTVRHALIRTRWCRGEWVIYL